MSWSSSSSSKQQRYGWPQAIALLMLAAFIAQAAYLSAHTPFSETELQFAGNGVQQSPLTTHIAHVLFRLSGHEWIARVPFILFGALLGASVWYVARRLYGNMGGYVALGLYTFSPAMITYSARVMPEIAAAWGMFGCVFTGIAVGHTLYAPREVVLWNWKRIVLLAVAIGLGMSSQFAVVLALPIALAFMFYLVPERRSAALAIIGAATALGLVLVLLMHGFQFEGLLAAARPVLAPTLRVAASKVAWYMVLLFLFRSGPGFLLLFLTALITYAAWRRTRFFGTAAPLLTFCALVAIGLLLPQAAGFSFLLPALPFLFVFVAGVAADLLQTRQSHLAAGLVIAALAGHAYFSLFGLWKL
jgi:hypothetical protein